METKKKTRRWLIAIGILVLSGLVTVVLFPVFTPARRAAQHSYDFASMKTSPAASPVPSEDSGQASWTAAYAASGARMVISTAQMRVEVPDVLKAHAEVESIASSAGGFITESYLNNEGGVTEASITLRVPSKEYQSVLDRIGNLGKVLLKGESGEDVTEEYVDLQSRLRNLQREEEALLGVLKKAGKVTDILAVDRELGRVRGEIEQATGRAKFLENRVALATIKVTLSAPTPAVSKIVSWDLVKTARGAVNALEVVFRAITSAIIWLVIFIPLWLLILLVVYVYRRRVRNRV